MKQLWKCRRCGEMVNMELKKCGCKISPSPWEPIPIEIPKKFVNDIGYDLYGGVVQYYIKGIDGTLAQLGKTLPPTKELKDIIDYAKKQNKKLINKHNKNL